MVPRMFVAETSVHCSLVRTCSDCDQQLDDLSQPCPNCGSTRQTAHVTISPVTVKARIPIGRAIDPDRSEWRARRAKDSLGLPISATSKITASPLDEDGMYHYELSDHDGN